MLPSFIFFITFIIIYHITLLLTTFLFLQEGSFVRAWSWPVLLISEFLIPSTALYVEFITEKENNILTSLVHLSF